MKLASLVAMNPYHGTNALESVSSVKWNSMWCKPLTAYHNVAY